MTPRHWSVHTALILVALAFVAAAAPKPWFLTDEGIYEGTARQIILPDCSDLQCVRVLAPWIVGRLPGPQTFRWKSYAVLATTAAALALGRFCVAAGLSGTAASLAMWLVAFGFAPMLTLYNPYTADPLMYLAGPLVATMLWQGRRGQATLVASVGVLAKEVAAAPLWIFWIMAILRRRWDDALRLFAMAFGATLVWVWLQIALIIAFDYSYGGSKSVDLLHGGDFVVWWGAMGIGGGISALVAAFGALWILVPAGIPRARRDLRLLALAAVPAALVLCYVQQPDRALWNFHYVFLPFAALVLERLAVPWRWSFVACYAFANVRVGANLDFLPSARYALVPSVLLAVVAIASTVRGARVPAAEPAA